MRFFFFAFQNLVNTHVFEVNSGLLCTKNIHILTKLQKEDRIMLFPYSEMKLLLLQYSGICRSVWIENYCVLHSWSRLFFWSIFWLRRNDNNVLLKRIKCQPQLCWNSDTKGKKQLFRWSESWNGEIVSKKLLSIMYT